MKFIVITQPQFIDNEAQLIELMLLNGVDLVQIRKPHASDNEVDELLCQINPEYHSRLILNGNFNLLKRYEKIKMIHHSSRSCAMPEDFNGIVGISTHSPEEIILKKQNYDYLFLSPIYDSISKNGYSSNFSYDELNRLKEKGIIDNKVYALGGVTPDKIDALKNFGFGGFAVLGYIWNSSNSDELVKRVKEFKSKI